MENENMDYNVNEQQETATKTSPFADSPYEAVAPVEAEKPIKKVKKEKTAKPVSGVLVALTVIAVVVSIVSASVAFNLNNQLGTVLKTIDNRIEVLKQETEATVPSANGQKDPTDDTALTPGQVYAQNVKAVVAISNQALSTNLFGQVSETASSGSGFIVSEDGYVVTNYHVVAGATTLKVITWDAKEYNAKLVGGDAGNDLAVLKIEGDAFPYVTLGSSNDMIVGDRVAAIGNPLL